MTTGSAEASISVRAVTTSIPTYYQLSVFLGQSEAHLIEIKFRNGNGHTVELIDIQNEVDEILNLFISTFR
jgi:hypothetical protein